MDPSARAFMTSAEVGRAKAYWACYQKQTHHALAASQEHERCVGLQHGIQTAQFVDALRTTSMLAAREAALFDFARQRGWNTSTSKKKAQEDAADGTGQGSLKGGAQGSAQETAQGRTNGDEGDYCNVVCAREEAALQLSASRFQMAQTVLDAGFDTGLGASIDTDLDTDIDAGFDLDFESGFEIGNAHKRRP